MSTYRTRKALLTGASLVAVGMLLTACGPDDIPGGDSDKSASPSSKPSASKSDDASPSPDKNVKGNFVGQVKYLAPGKLTVTTEKGIQGFFTTRDTKITGWGTICGEPNQRTECTERMLEYSARTKKVIARVVLNDGKATAVTERKPSTAPDTGGKKFMGQVKHLAPGKFTVTTEKGIQAFNMAKDTKITGWGTICGEPNQRTKCTARELATSAQKKKVIARVVLNDDGKATAVTERKPSTAPDTGNGASESR